VRRLGQEPCYDFSFTRAKGWFAESFKYFIDTASRGGFDFGVCIPEGHSEGVRQPPSNRRFPCPHHSNENYGFIELPHSFAYTGPLSSYSIFGRAGCRAR
jgi:hypothetical protein